MPHPPGRPPWTTTEQYKFLEEYLPRLEGEKAGNGLTQFYARITRDFSAIWEPPVVEKDRTAAKNVDELQKLAYNRRGRQISDWFKKQRKTSTTSSQPKPVLDLTGRSGRKPPPLQLHHAFSVRYYRPEGSALRDEVNHLWEHRQEQEVADLFSPFMVKGEDSDTRMLFHNAVMRQKCSLLTEDEKAKFQVWIDDDVQRRWEGIKEPWKTTGSKDISELTAENQYVQGLMNAIPVTMQAALDEVERTTGMRSILLMGGPIPAQDGAVGTHLYITGRSRASNLTFSKAWEGYNSFHDAFVQWLRTTYSEDERARRRGHSSDVIDAIPPRLDVSDPTTVTGGSIVPGVSAAPNVSAIPDITDSATPPPQTAAEDDHHCLSPPTPATAVQPQPAIASALENDGHAAPPPSPLDTPLESPLDNTPPTTPAAPTTSDDVTTAGHFADPLAIPTPPVVFTFDGSSNFITSSAIAYLETIPGGQAWVDMVKVYLLLERLPILPGCPFRLSTASRPAEIGVWMKGRSFTSDRLPYVHNTSVYGRAWIAWWTACQPRWRQGKGWPLPKEQGTETNWGKLAARGQNGIFIVVMSTTWWAASLKPTDHRGTFDEAVDDIRWVIDQILESNPAPVPGAMEATVNPSPHAVQKPTPTATWQERGDGKRKSKPSQRLLEALN